MAFEYYHSFVPTGSVTVLLTVIALIAVAIFTGIKSVKVRPRRVSNYEYQKGEPRFVSTKVKVVKEEFKHVLKLNLRREMSDSTIVMPSVTADIFQSIIAGIIFAGVFCAEHWFGMVQAFINVLAPTDGAAWGDIMASIVVFFMALGAAGGYYIVRECAQYKRAVKLYREYFFVHKKKPVIIEKPHAVFIARRLAWAVGEIRKELRKERAMKKARKQYAEIVDGSNGKVTPIKVKAI
ncbi:MAG: hypothetical protein MJ154_01100 [Candidatus Saccharibacteria bacterium]|nr:hypothetical protein [Candidatus Saccharibacteria bacterium]